MYTCKFITSSAMSISDFINLKKNKLCHPSNDLLQFNSNMFYSQYVCVCLCVLLCGGGGLCCLYQGESFYFFFIRIFNCFLFKNSVAMAGIESFYMYSHFIHFTNFLTLLGEIIEFIY